MATRMLLAIILQNLKQNIMHPDRPQPLLPGSRIGLIAPASLPDDLSRIDRGIAALETHGFQVVRYRNFNHGPGYLAGTDQERADELNHFLLRTDLDALICVRGGYGCMRILPLIDFEAAREHPKLLIGYSDITALHLAFLAQAGWAGLSGPMVAIEWPDAEETSIAHFLDFAGGATGPLLGPLGETLRGVKSGAAEGLLVGGNLSMVVRLLGTPYLPSLKGSILAVEDVGEEPYQIDAYLSQLHLSGVLQDLGGLVLGGITEGDIPSGKRSLSMQEVLDHYIDLLSCPVATNLVYGHFSPKSTLPIGVQSRFNVSGETASLDVLEPVVRA